MIGVLQTLLQMIEQGATHVGVATDHVIESFRNDLWSGYKTGDGIEPALFAQFHPLEEALAAMGVVVWPMIELEADDALASAARIAAEDRARREGLHLDARQGSGAVRPRRPRRAGRSQRRRRSAMPKACARSSASSPILIPDFLALVGDAADGYPGIPGIGAVTAARLLNRHGAIEDFSTRGAAATAATSRFCSRDLATLRTDAPLFHDVDELRWRGPTDAFASWTQRMRGASLARACPQGTDRFGSGRRRMRIGLTISSARA